MYIFFILAMVVAAFGGPLIGAGNEAVRAAEVVEVSRTRVLSDSILAHHRAALTYARSKRNPTTGEANFTGPITTDTLTVTSAADPDPWAIYGSASDRGITKGSANVSADFASYADRDANAVITYSRTAGDFTGAFTRSYDRSGVAKRLARRATAGTYAGVLQEASSAAARFRNTGSVRQFTPDTPSDAMSMAEDGAYSSLQITSPLGREARALPFTNGDFGAGTIVLVTQYGTGNLKVDNPFD